MDPHHHRPPGAIGRRSPDIEGEAVLGVLVGLPTEGELDQAGRLGGDRPEPVALLHPRPSGYRARRPPAAPALGRAGIGNTREGPVAVPLDASDPATSDLDHPVHQCALQLSGRIADDSGNLSSSAASMPWHRTRLVRSRSKSGGEQHFHLFQPMGRENSVSKVASVRAGRPTAPDRWRGLIIGVDGRRRVEADRGRRRRSGLSVIALCSAVLLGLAIGPGTAGATGTSTTATRHLALPVPHGHGTGSRRHVRRTGPDQRHRGTGGQAGGPDLPRAGGARPGR